MNERKRFRRLMGGEPVDRPPLLEEGVREDVLEMWRTQGLPGDKTHMDLFDLTPHERVGPDLTFPADRFGRICHLSPDEYREAFDISRRRFPADWQETVRRLRERDHIVCIWASRGLFQALGVGDWSTLEEALVAAAREPGRTRDRMEHYAEFCSGLLRRTMEDVDPEFIYLSEPISDNSGPLVSPAMFRELMIPVYEGIVATARNFGCENVLVSTYGDTRLLFPDMIRAGVSLLWISEAADVPALDYRRLRRELGPGVGLIGGIPLSVLRSGSPDLIEERLREIVPPLLESGRYVPLAGGRVRKAVSWPAYRCYREVLAELVGRG